MIQPEATTVARADALHAAASIRRSGRARLLEAAVVTAAFSAAAVAFWLGFFVPRFQHRAGSWGTLDLLAYFYPKFIYGAQAVNERRIPLWNPDEFCGIPFLATAQVAALYPVKHVIFSVFTPPVAVQANYVVHLIIAGVCMWAYARWLGLAPAAVALAAVLWAFQHVFVESVYHPNRIMVLAWVPLVFLVFERALARRTVGAAALAGGVIALDTTAGYPGFVLCLGAFLAVGTIFHALAAWRASPFRVIATAVGVTVFAAAFAAPQILPLGEMVAESSRADLLAHPASRALDAAALIHSVLAPARQLLFAVGPVLGLAVAGIVLGRRNLGWPVAASLALAYSGGVPGELPGFRLLREAWNLWLMFPPFFEAMLIALGLDAAMREDRKRWLVALLLLGAPLVTGLYLGIKGLTVPLGLLVAGAALASRSRPWVAGGVVALVGAVVVGGTLASVPYRHGAAPYPEARPDEALQRLVGRELRSGRVFAPSFVRNGQQMISRLPVVTGYEASVRPRRIGKLLDAAGLRDNLVGFGPDWPTIARSRSLLDLLGVSLLVSPLDLTLFGLSAGPALPDGLVMYRNPTALPRAYLAHRVRAVASEHEAYAAVVDPDFRPKEETVVEGQAPVVEPARGFEFAGIDRDDPEHVSVITNSSGPALLVLADSWFPGWEASESDVPLPILRVNYAFRGVVVGHGAHRIDFRYRPRMFRAGVAIAVVAAVVALLAAIGRRLRRPAVPA